MVAITSKRVAETVILRSDSFIEDLFRYIEDAAFADLRKKIEERLFRVGQTGLSYRVISHWGSMGLLPEDTKTTEAGWRKFSLIEVVWLHAAQKMRTFGVSLEKIARAKEGTLEWGKVGSRHFLLEYYISQAWLTNADPYFVIFADGTASIATSAELESSKLMLTERDMLLISIKTILENIGLHPQTAERLRAVDHKAQHILDEMRDEKNREVTIKRDPKKDYMELTSTKYEADPKAIKRVTSDIEHGRTYASLSTEYAEGVHQITKITTKKRVENALRLSEQPRP